ncbi:MAG: OmpA family protein [Phycisphaerae bacterium]|nr:OmpA family protein [Phycisphaerae bacterium]
MNNVAKLIGLGVLAAATMVATGCGVDQKDHDMVTQENAELRDRLTAVENQSRQRDAELADAQAKARQAEADLAAAKTAQQPPYREPTTGSTGNRGETIMVLAGDVGFDSGSATIKSTAKKQLDQIASRIKREYSGASIRVEGYTDSTQPNKMKAKFPTNEALSEARAESVRAYLASKGVNNPMSAVGYGSAKPKSTKAASRRVEIHVGN